MLKLDHLTVIAPNLGDGVAHVKTCLDLDVPFGAKHHYMGTHNHRLMLGGSVYLEIVALDPNGIVPGHARWFGLDDQEQVRKDWEDGRRLKGWVANTPDMETALTGQKDAFGQHVQLPPSNPAFDFSIPEDGSLPMAGAAPSLIGRRGTPEPKGSIPDLGARLRTFILEHPDPERMAGFYQELDIDHPPEIQAGPVIRYRAEIETSDGLKTLT